MKFKFLQGGGNFNPRYSVYEPYIVPEEENSGTKSTSKGSKEKSQANDILKMIKDSFSNGLPSDLQAASNTIASVFSNIERMLEDPDMYGGTGGIASAYARALPLLRSIEFNSKEYENVYKSLNDSKSMQEVAVNSVGHIAVISDEGFTWITPEEYHQNSELYQPITNAQLLNSRANSPSLAFNDTIFETLKNGVSTDSITTQILEYASKVGSTEQVQNGYGYVPGTTLMKDFYTFSQKMKSEGFDPSQDDLYSYEVTTKSERENAYLMLDIIYRMLPQTHKALLKYKSNGTDDGAKGMIAILMGTATDHSVSSKISLEGGYSKDSGSGSGDKYFDHVFRAAMGLGEDKTFVITPGSTNTLKVHGVSIPIMENSTTIMQGNLLSDVAKSRLGNMMLTSDISIAGQHVDSSQDRKIYLLEKRGTLVDLPWTYEEGTNHIVPDYGLLEQKDKVEEKIKNESWTFKDNFEQIQQFIKEQGFTIKFNRQGEAQFPNRRRFVLFQANFPEDIFVDNKIKKGNLVKPISNKSTAEATYTAILTANGWKKSDWNYDVDGWFPDPMYTGSVAIPVDDTYLNVVGQNLDATTVIELGKLDQQNKARENFNYDDRQLGQ